MFAKVRRLCAFPAALQTQHNHRAVLTCSLALLVLFGISLFVVARGAAKPAPAASNAAYLTAPVLIGDVTSSLNVTGSLHAVVTAKVGSQLSGQIDQLLVDFNDYVKKGQIMARLDSRMYELRVRAAEAALEVAKARVQMARASATKSVTDIGRAHDAMAVAAARENSIRAKVENLRSTLDRKRVLGERGVLSQSQIQDLTAGLESAVSDLQAAESELRAAAGAIKGAEAVSNMANTDILLSEGLVRKAVAELEQARTDLERTEIQGNHRWHRNRKGR